MQDFALNRVRPLFATLPGVSAPRDLPGQGMLPAATADDKDVHLFENSRNHYSAIVADLIGHGKRGGLTSVLLLAYTGGMVLIALGNSGQTHFRWRTALGPVCRLFY